MKTLSVSLEVISPTAIRLDHAASRTSSSDFIPGNTLLGGLATIHRVLRPEQTEEFEQIFLHGGTLYSNLYPATFKSKDIESMETKEFERLFSRGKTPYSNLYHIPVYPMPKTAQSCKRHKGFLPIEGEDGDGHGVRDSLVDWTVFKLGDSYSSLNRLAALNANKTCKSQDSECNEPLDHFEGYYRRSTINTERLTRTKNETRLQTHTGIDRESGTVREGILYNRQVFEEGSKFWGEIRLVDEALVTSFNSFLQEVKGSELLRLGTGRTRGMGKVRINVEIKETNTVEDRLTNLKRRVEDLDAFTHKTITKFGAGAEDIQKLSKQFFFALTLHSPVILTDEFLRYRSRIDVEALYELFGIAYDKQNEQTNVYNLKSVYSNFSYRRVTGWQELWGTPRTNEYAIDTGSVFLFQCDKDKREKVLDALFNLEELGIGNRRAEGFGRVCVSDPFHLRGEQK
jgi:CRISPR-associated protein Csx10